MNLFTKHPREAGETYFEHQRTALGFSAECLSAAYMAFVHSIFPFLYERGASTKIKSLNDRLQARAK
jgi:hypothetical protein